jgi:hypothetical protein
MTNASRRPNHSLTIFRELYMCALIDIDRYLDLYYDVLQRFGGVCFYPAVGHPTMSSCTRLIQMPVGSRWDMLQRANVTALLLPKRAAVVRCWVQQLSRCQPCVDRLSTRQQMTQSWTA